MQNGSGFKPYDPNDVNDWMALRRAGRLGGMPAWTGGAGATSRDDFQAQRLRDIAEARRRKNQRDTDEPRRALGRFVEENTDPSNPMNWTLPTDLGEAALEASKKFHELLWSYFKEHDLGAEARDQSYLLGPRNGYNPYDDMPQDRRRR